MIRKSSGQKMMLARVVDALLIASCQETLESFYSVHNLRTPFLYLIVLFRTCAPTLSERTISPEASWLPITLFRSDASGLHTSGGPDISAAAERFRGFNIALRDRDLELRQEFVLSSLDLEGSDDATGYEMMRT